MRAGSTCTDASFMKKIARLEILEPRVVSERNSEPMVSMDDGV